MTIYKANITLKAKGFADTHNITPNLEQILTESGISEGLCTVILPGSTGGITTIEYEPEVLKDMRELLEQITPQNKHYHHDAAWGDGNGFSHLRSALIGTSMSIPFSSAKLVLGTWQQVVFIDFDNRARQRTLYVQLLGE